MALPVRDLGLSQRHIGRPIRETRELRHYFSIDFPQQFRSFVEPAQTDAASRSRIRSSAREPGARAECFPGSFKGFARVRFALAITAGTALRERGIGECGNREERKRSLFVKGQIVDCQIVAHGGIPKLEGALPLGARREQLHGELVIRSQSCDVRGIETAGLFNGFSVLSLNHASLRQVETNAKHIRAFRPIPPGERRDEFPKQPLRLSSIARTDGGEGELLFQREAGVFIEARQLGRTVGTSLKLFRRYLRLVLDQCDHAARGSQPHG